MTDAQQMHDAQKTLSNLRNHLARHDKPIAFLFGAGTSCAVRIPDANNQNETVPLIPDVEGLTKKCREEVDKLPEKHKKAWTLIATQCKENKQDPNIENILSRLRIMLSAVGNTDTLSGLNATEIEVLEKSVRETIAEIVTPESIPNDYAHFKFARWLIRTLRQNPVEIFTLNYDVLIEHALESERVPFFDGFVGSYQPFFYQDSLRNLESAPGANWARLWKMHGSVTWKRIKNNGRVRVVRGIPDTKGEMIYPSSQKYDESRQQPYSAFTDRLSRFLEQDDALLVVAGFSFRDENINNLIFGALENRPRTHVYALQFGELPEKNDLIERAIQRPNMIVIGQKTGIIGGRHAAWTPVESPTPSMQVAFELSSDGTPGGYEDAASKSGLMKIGDFGSFCNFLESMTAS